MQVIKQLKDGLQPCIYDVECDWGGDTNKDFCQAPMKTPPLYDGTRLLVYRLWEGNTTVSDKVKIVAQTPEGALSVEVDINQNDFVQGTVLAIRI